MNRNSKGVPLIAVGILTLLGTLVTSQSVAQSARVRQAAAQQAVSPRAEERLVREVGHELHMLPYYTVFDNLEYHVTSYRVELRGQVTRPTLKFDAEAIVKRIEGVEAIDNHIEVLPVSTNDDRLRLALYQAVYSHPVLTRYALQAVPPLHIIVKNGRVTLVGVVATEMERNVAYLQANSVPGIFSVTNNVQVEARGHKA